MLRSTTIRNENGSKEKERGEGTGPRLTSVRTRRRDRFERETLKECVLSVEESRSQSLERKDERREQGRVRTHFLNSSSFVAALNSLITPPPSKTSSSHAKYLTYRAHHQALSAQLQAIRRDSNRKESSSREQKSKLTKATPSLTWHCLKPSSSTRFLIALASVTGDRARSRFV